MATDNYWFTLDQAIKVRDDDTIVLRAIKDEDGNPVDVLLWTLVEYKAEHQNSDITDTITVAGAAMTKSDSGTGTTDTITIPISSTDSDVSLGKYDHSFIITVSGSDRTFFDGTLYVSDKQAEVP